MVDEMEWMLFASELVDEFRTHALAVTHGDPVVVRGARWSDAGIVLDYVVEAGQTLEGGVSRDVALELLARTYRIRSGRVDTSTWKIPLPPSDFQDRLEDRFPVYRHSGLEVGGGWYDLLTAMAEWLEEVDADREPFMQTKDKLGQFRAYGPLTDAEPIVEAAQLLSQYLCDVCGRLGGPSSGATRCADHA